MEIWLHANRRVLLLGMILPVVLIAVGLIPVFALATETGAWLRIVGWITVAVGTLLLGNIFVQWKLPRLAYADGQLHIYLRTGRPIVIPVEYVECFFWGSGAGQLPGPDGREIPVRNLVLRVAERAKDFQHREVKAMLGRWDDGYVTIHGAWCEPLTLDVVQRLNARLAQAQQFKKESPKI
ncbi:MAG TPA: hypothetical protein VFE46_17650 [Pirellulales bacterium]|jgi:hypothetical protein|nr:hypothetical protein [Pirellulales bacterium]